MSEKKQDTSAMRRVAETWVGPKSICRCGHTGDVQPTGTNTSEQLEGSE